MPKNVGTTDRLVRLVVAAAAVLGSVATGVASAAGIILLVLAAVLLATGLAGSCPLYVPFRLSTRRRGDATA